MSTAELTGGVDYTKLDPFKVLAQRMAAETDGNLPSRFRVLPWSRGESAFLVADQEANCIHGSTIEGLGTKNLVAEDRDLRDAAGAIRFYESIGIDNVAMAVNDLITLGVLPMVYMLHPALHAGKHLEGTAGEQLLRGTVSACNLAKCVFGPGETPALSGIIREGTMCLSGACTGILYDIHHLMAPQRVVPHSRIIALRSSGVHANGITALRELADPLPDRYLTDIGNGRTFGKEILTATSIYAPFIRECQKQNLSLFYGVNVTGHGLRKIMRAPQDLTYKVTRLPEPPPIFPFIQNALKMTDREMYAAYNMGIGFIVFTSVTSAPAVMAVADALGYNPMDIGSVESGKRQVVIEPLGITYEGKDLELR
jgi:phosphoribosylformylglycinamidine cyclo-ligase